MSELHDERISRAIRAAAEQVAPITLAEVLSRGPIDEPVDGDDLSSNGRLPEHRLRSESTEEPIMVMELERQDTTERSDAQRRRRVPRWLAAAAAVLLVLVGATALWAAADDDTSVEVSPPASEPAADASAAQVDDFLATYNAGDWDAIQAVLAEDLDPIATNIEHRRVKQIDPAYVVAGDRWTRTGPCRASGDEVVCPIERRDDFHGAAGITTTADYVFVFDDSGRLEQLNLRADDPWAEQHAFRVDFREWVQRNRPDVSIQFFAPAERSIAELGDLPVTASMATALDVVDDFVAQSDRWGP